MNSMTTSYVLWMGCFLGLGGLQRLYNGKIVSGLLLLGLIGFGRLLPFAPLYWIGFLAQLVDLLLIPQLVRDYNANRKTLRNTPDAPSSLLPQMVWPEDDRDTEIPSMHSDEISLHGRMLGDRPPATPHLDRLTTRLVKAAHARGGKLSVTQGVLDTEASFADVETALRALVKTGYIDAYNDPDTGIVFYEFREL
jgi:TM2 domain-containing membrane protein YozV